MKFYKKMHDGKGVENTVKSGVREDISTYNKIYRIHFSYKIVSGWRVGEKACFGGFGRLGKEIYTGNTQIGKSFNTIKS